jgi:hypothetical protein
MYNGIGLETARGSGTNGFVQRNLSFVRRHKDKVDYKSEEELKKIEAQMTKGPNKDILDHERKRKVELKCMEMQELMEEQGYALLECLPVLILLVVSLGRNKGLPVSQYDHSVFICFNPVSSVTKLLSTWI